MVNSQHSGKLKSTPKLCLCSSSRNINENQLTPSRSCTNEDENSFKETVKENEGEEGESLFGIIRNVVKEEFKAQRTN